MAGLDSEDAGKCRFVALGLTEGVPCPERQGVKGQTPACAGEDLEAIEWLAPGLEIRVF